MILYRVVSPAFEHLGDFSPFVLDLPVHQEQDPLLLLAPPTLFDFGVQVVVPSLAALLTDALRHLLRDQSPLLSPDLLNELNQEDVLFHCPGCLVWVASGEVSFVVDFVALFSIVVHGIFAKL